MNKYPHFAIPEIYGESLSYYEVLRKLVKAMNEVIENYDTIPDQIAEEVKNLDASKLFSTVLNQLIHSIATDNTKSINAVKVYNKHDLLYATFNDKVNLYESLIDFTTGTETELIVGSNIREVNISELFIELRELINNEAQARKQADQLLQTNIGNEAQAREQADQLLQTNIGNEAQAREQADNKNSAKIATIRNDITAIENKNTEQDNELNTLRTMLSSPYNFKGDVASISALPASGNINDTYYVKDVKYKVTWTGSAWVQSSISEADYQTELGELKGDIVTLSNNLVDFLYTSKLKLPSIFVPGNLEDNGQIVPFNNRYTSEKYIKVPLDCTLKTSSSAVICFYNNDLSLISRNAYNDNTITISKNSIFRITVIGFNNSEDAWKSVHFYSSSFFKNALVGSNISFNNSTIPDGNKFDFNKSFESKIYEFDIDFDNTKVLNAPFYPFKGTAIVFSPCGIKEQYSGDDISYYAVGTVQMIFKSRNVTNYDGKYYIRCYLSSSYDKPIWSDWKEYNETEYFNSKFTDIDVNGCDLFQCFENFCVIGDSISAGYTNIGGITVSSETAVLRGANWPNYLSLSLSREVLNLSKGGSKTIDWRNTLKDGISKKECFIIYLGGNDMATNYNIGTADDIKADYNDNNESYYGNYDYLVRYIHEKYPNSVIFCISNTLFDNGKYKTYNSACRHIANLYSYCHYIDIIDEVEKQNSFLSNNFNGHFSPIGYKVYEKCIRNSINKYMYENYNKFLGVPYSTD